VSEIALRRLKAIVFLVERYISSIRNAAPLLFENLTDDEAVNAGRKGPSRKWRKSFPQLARSVVNDAVACSLPRS
jgi:hypothetical protein